MSPRRKYLSDLHVRALHSTRQNAEIALASSFEKLLRDSVPDGERRGLDPSLLVLASLSTRRERIKEQITIAIGVARHNGVPMTAIAEALGVSSDGNFGTAYSDHAGVMAYLDQVESGRAPKEYKVGKTRFWPSLLGLKSRG